MYDALPEKMPKGFSMKKKSKKQPSMIYPTMSPAHSMYGGQVPGYPQPGFVPQYYQGGPVPQGYPQAQHFMPRQDTVQSFAPMQVKPVQKEKTPEREEQA